MTTDQCINKLKKDLKAIDFQVIISEWIQEQENQNVSKDFNYTYEIMHSYNKGIQMIMAAIDTHLYRITDREFYTILEEILGGIGSDTEAIYKSALNYRDYVLNRPEKSEKEYEAYISYLESTNEAADFQIKK
jgi:hypothetical protein